VSSGRDEIFAGAVARLASKAAQIVCVGSCAAFGGIRTAGRNQAGIRSVSAHTGRATINLAGCPPHPNWVVWTIVQLLLDKRIALDALRRPAALYSPRTDGICPPRGTHARAAFDEPDRHVSFEA
jgi:Ni,Fe-hydrogenase I small subunit